MKPFITENFLLQSESARKLYFEYAQNEPIVDYHCHLSPREVAIDRQFENMTQIWLGGDHYKWRAMRAAGVPEKYITGDASDWEKFKRWAEICPLTVRNPLFHWTGLELNRPFGINDRFLDETSAQSIWDECNEKLAKPEFSARGIMRQMNVELVCTTDDPIDSLEYHKQIAQDVDSGKFSTRVLPTFRPDKVFPRSCSTPEGVVDYLKYLAKLAEAADTDVSSFAALRVAFAKRHAYFHEVGARLSDCGFELFQWEAPSSNVSLETSFSHVLKGEVISEEETVALSSALLSDLGRLNSEKNWTSQLHIGAMRNNSTRIMKKIGVDAGCDSMIDGAYGKALSRYLDSLDKDDKLPKTIVYNLNPDANYLLASLVANFNDGTIPGKMQYGSGWWFLDQKNGMEEQLETLSNMGLLSLFVGMLTDSRSFLSYTRHEYFRRILCNLLGNEMETGIIPNDFKWIGKIVKNICHDNAIRYFQF
ncbi:MAG: glucuronate isomerase [Thermoguttaceae bacterium]|nr:glucuronate isomerase [Thermoguttaceae bacterium]